LGNVEDVFRALADPTRRELLDRLYARNGQSLGQLSDQMAMTRQAVSQHLAILEAADLVVTVRRGREKLHYLNPVPIAEISERWIRKYERQRLDALAELKRELQRTGE
jgi:DNA-binding transcriptional ArsR family regulator